jgi:hypothetical protein
VSQDALCASVLALSDGAQAMGREVTRPLRSESLPHHLRPAMRKRRSSAALQERKRLAESFPLFLPSGWLLHYPIVAAQNDEMERRWHTHERSRSDVCRSCFDLCRAGSAIIGPFEGPKQASLRDAPVGDRGPGVKTPRLPAGIAPRWLRWSRQHFLSNCIKTPANDVFGRGRSSSRASKGCG